MSRTKFFDFRAPDSTSLFNNKLRGILDAGVYKGFTVSAGSSGGLWLKFSHDADPDNTGDLLGVLVTPDGVIIQENADQDNAVQGSVSAGTPNIHYVVASYTYNQSLPNNDVSYLVKQGTAGASPTPPSLTDDEVLLTEIYVPSGASSYSTIGVIIKNVAKKSVFTVPNIIQDQLVDVLKPGIYEGINPSQGSTDLDVTLSSGTWITNENRRIVESSDLTDFDSITNPGNGYYRYAWIIGMHKDENSDPVADVDYMLVEGTAVAIGSAATLPSNSDILTAAQAIRPEYTSSDYINKLGYLRCENRSGTYIIDYFKGETFLDHDSLIVYSGDDNSLNRSGKYFGHDGLVQAISDIYALSASRSSLNEPYTLKLDGEFKLSSETLYLPSNIVLEGYGSSAKISSETNDVVNLGGFLANYSASAVIEHKGEGTGTLSGYTPEKIEVRSAYQTGDDLAARLFSAGDKIFLYDNTGAVLYQGVLIEIDTGTSDWTIHAFIETAYHSAGHPENCDVLILKRNNGLKNVEIDRISATNGNLTVQCTENSVLENVVTRDFTCSLNRGCDFRSLRIIDDPTFSADSIGSGANLIESAGNRAGTITLEKDASTLSNILQGFNGSVDVLRYENPLNAMVMTVNGGSVGVIEVQSSDSSKVVLADGCRNVDTVLGDLEVTGNDIAVMYVYGDVTIGSSVTGSKVYHVYGSSYPGSEFSEFVNQDRNLSVFSNASISYDSTAETITWDDDIKFDLPTVDSGYGTLASGSATINSSNDVLYFNLDRGSSAAISLSTTTKASVSALAKKSNLIIFARLYDGVVYLWDGSRIEDGQTIKIGATPPPDGSVTYNSFSTSTPGADTDPLAFHNKFFRDYVSVDNSDWGNQVYFKNSGLSSISYTASTGVIQFSGSPDLSDSETAFNAGIPLIVILRNIDFSPGSVNGAYTREEILDIDASSYTVTVAKGLGISSLGAANLWNGAIVSGNVAMTNESLTAWTYDPDGSNPGRISWGGSNMQFSEYQVRPGYYFVDNAGVKYKILRTDTSAGGSAWVDIAPGLRDISAGTPSSVNGGSIITGDNPHVLNFADLRTRLGAEFIPIDSIGEIDNLNDTSLLKSYFPTVSDVDFNTSKITLSKPYDPRIRLVYTQNLTSESVIGNDEWTPSEQSIYAVSFTGVCTGLAVVASSNNEASSVIEVYLDGEKLSQTSRMQSSECANTYGIPFNRNEIIVNYRIMRLPQGVHNIVLTNLDRVNIRGLYVINSPLYGTYAIDSPGTLVKNGGVLSKSTPSSKVSLPSNPTYNKGQRIVRYVNSAGSYAWSTNSVRTFTDTANVALYGSTITVSNPSYWRVGDMFMLINSNRRYLHVVISKSGSTLGVSPPTGFAQTSETMYYYGHVYQDYNSSYPNFSRENEERAFTCNIQEFAAPGTLYEGLGTAGLDTSNQLKISTRLSCGSVLITGVGTSAFKHSLGGLLLDSANAYIRISFVGTGLSMKRLSSGDPVELYVDGVQCDDLEANNSGSVDVDTDSGETFICGDLPYGQHVIKIVTPAATSPVFRIDGITIYQPKKPSFTGFELLDTNVLADSEGDFGITKHDASDMNGPEETQFGTINYDAGALCNQSCLSEDVLSDVLSTPDDTIAGIYHDIGGSGGTFVSDTFLFPFYGDEITLVTHGTSDATGSLNVKFLDTNGVLTSPSALAGFTVSESAGDNIPDSSDYARRLRWKLDLGFHVLAIILGDASETLELDSIEVHSPFHHYAVKDPITHDHSVPLCHSGIDMCNSSPFRSDIPGTQIINKKGITLHHDVTAVTINNQIPFIFYTRGGIVTLRCNAYCEDVNSTTTSFFLRVDGVTVTHPHYAPPDEYASHDFSVTLQLGAGYHFAYIHDTPNSGSNKVKYVNWSIEEIINHPNSLISRSLGVPLLGPSIKGERSY